MKTNKNGVKLLAFVAIMAMVLAGTAVILDSSDSDADIKAYASADPFKGLYVDGSGVTYSDTTGTITVNKPTTIQLKDPLTTDANKIIRFVLNANLTITSESGENNTLTINSVLYKGDDVFTGEGKLTVNNANVTVVAIAGETYDNSLNSHIFDVESTLEITGKSTVTLTQTDAKGQTIAGGSTVTVSGSDAKLILSGANAVSATTLNVLDGAQVSIDNPNASALSVYLTMTGGSKITSTTAATGGNGNIDLYSANLDASTINTTGNVRFLHCYDGKSTLGIFDIDSSSSITAGGFLKGFTKTATKAIITGGGELISSTGTFASDGGEVRFGDITLNVNLSSVTLAYVDGKTILSGGKTVSTSNVYVVSGGSFKQGNNTPAEVTDANASSSTNPIPAANSGSLVALGETGGYITVSASIELRETLELSNDTTLVVNNAANAIDISNYPIKVNSGSTFKGYVKNTDGDTANITSLTGSFTLSDGSIVIGSETYTNGEVEVSGNIEIKGTVANDITLIFTGATDRLTIPADNLEIKEGATLTIKEKDENANLQSLTVTGKLSIRGNIVNLAGAMTVTGGSNVQIYSTANLQNISFTGATFATDDPQFQFKGYMTNDVTVSNEQSLTGDLYIASGYKLTVASGGILNMNGYGIYVEGTLAIEANGAVINIGTGTGTQYGNKIILWKDGVISNAGVIGSGSEVKVTAAIPTAPGTWTSPAIVVPSAYKDSAKGEADMKNVTGVEFTVAKNGNDYVLNITGDVSSYGMSGENTISLKNVIIIDEFTVGEGVILNASETNVIKKGAVVEIYGTVTGGANIYMNNGTTVEIYGTVDAIRAYVGDLPINAAVFNDKYANVALNKVTNVILSVGQNQHIVNTLAGDVTYVEQRLYINGTVSYIDDENTDGASITITSDASGSHIYVADDAVVALDKMTLAGNGKLIVLGQIQYNTANAVAGFIGTQYTIVDSVDKTKKTYYITTFEKAYAQIDAADKKTIKVYGDITFDSDITLNEGQKIDANTGVKFSIDEDATVTVNKGAIISGSVQKVDGVLMIKTGASCPTPAEYAVKKTGTDYVQYSGIAPALAGAQPGDVIDIKGATTVSDLKVPAQATVNVAEGIIVTVEKNLTIEEGAKLVNKGTINLTGEKSKVTVNGDLVSVDGTMAFTATLTPGADDFRSFDVSGKAVLGNAAFTSVGSKVNGAKYVDDSGNVITTPAKAAEAMTSVDGTRSVDVIGKISDSTAITLPKNTTLTITGEAVLGTITLEKGAKVDINGALTAEVIGQNGIVETTGAVTDSVVKVSKITAIEITTNSAVNSSGKTVWTTTITPDSGTTAVNGAIEIVSGAVQIADMKINGTDKTLVVSSEATLVVPVGKTLDVGVNGIYSAVTVKGTIIVNGDADVNGKMTVSGEMQVIKNNGDGNANVNVASGKTLTITGTVIVSDDETNNGTLAVAGIVKVGSAVTSTGAEASIAGGITITTGYVMAYAGSDVSAAKMNWNNIEDKTEAVSTKVVIGDIDYATLFAKKDNSISIVGDSKIITDSVEIAGLDLTNIETIGNDGLWFTNSALTTKLTDTNNVIGKKDAIYYDAPASVVFGKITAGTGLEIFIDGLSIDNFHKDGKGYGLTVGEHTVTLGTMAGYDGSKATIYFNGTTVSNGKIIVTADMNEYVLTASGATPAVTPTPEPTPIQPSEKDDGMGITEYLLIVLVVLAAILVVVVAIRMMRS